MAGVILIGQQPAAERATSDDTVAAVHQAIGVISAVCDYARNWTRAGSAPPTPGSGTSWRRCPPACGLIRRR